jgi:hypothetical protein
MNTKTVSEVAFEEFCRANGFAHHKIDEGPEPTPDYQMTIHGVTVFVEVKQIDQDEDFSATQGSRSPGPHIRAKINQARHQIRAHCEAGHPAILLVYNNLDPRQLFGTESHDFLAAMYGDLTVFVSRTQGALPGVFHGRNSSFRPGKNETFSAVGWLYRTQDGVCIRLYENAYAKVPLNYDALPPAIQFNRVEVEHASDA